jgi:hypothetical protein
VNIIRDQFNVAAFNAITDGAKLGDYIIETLKLKTKQLEQEESD